MSAHLPAVVLAACIVVTAAGAASIAVLWLGLLGASSALQGATLWKRYRA